MLVCPAHFLWRQVAVALPLSYFQGSVASHAHVSHMSRVMPPEVHMRWQQTAGIVLCTK